MATYSAGTTCFRGTSCKTANGYYSSKPNETFFNVATYSAGTTCYRATSCNEDNMLVTDCYTATNAITHISGNVSCTESIYHLCSTSYYHYYEEDLAGSVISRAFDYTSQNINGKTCYHVDGCKSGYTDDESKKKTGGNCYTYGQLTCYEADTGCPTGYYSTSPNTSFFTTSSSGSCYRATGCNTSAGAFSDASSVAEFFSMVSSTASGTTCYRATGCNSSSKANTTPPNSAIFEYKHSARSGISCYRATGCKDGYTTTDNGTTPSQYGYIKCYKNTTNCPRNTTEYCLYSAAVAANCPAPSGTELGGGWGGMCTITTNCDGTTSCRVIECNRYLYNNILLLDNANNPSYAGIGENGNLLACGWMMATEYTSGANGYETWVDSKGGAGTDWMDYCCKNCSHAGSTIPRIEDINESYRGYIDTDKCEARKIYMSTGEEVWHMLLK